MAIKKKWAAAGLAAMLLVGAASASAHDGWTQTNAPILAQGEVSYVDLQFGNHTNEHKSYRIVGQWNPATAKVFVTAPSGKKTDITSTMFYTGEAATETEPAVNNGFVATFSSSTPGAYIITGENESINATSLARSLRSSKSFVAVSDIPTLERVKALQGFANPVSLDRAELVPQFNPAAITPNQDVKVQLLLKGKPYADAAVNVIQRSNSAGLDLKTDKDGYISFKTGPADYYLIRTSITTNESEEGKYKSSSYSAVMTFIVQNGTVKPLAGKANPVPYVYLNGQPVNPAGLAVKNGSTWVDASFIQSNLNPSFDGTGATVLRTAADQAGAVVEYLPAVGESRAAILIYTK